MSRQNRGMRKRVKGRLHMAAPYIEDFKSWLHDSGYRETTIEERLRLLAYWTDWADAAGFTIGRVSAALDSFGAAFGGKQEQKESTQFCGTLYPLSARSRGRSAIANADAGTQGAADSR